MSDNNDGSDVFRSYYDVLEVPHDADSAAIRKAYLKLSLRYHPDKNPSNREEESKRMFIEIGQAYETLSDPVKRRTYDNELRQRQRGRRSAFNLNANGINTSDQVYDNYRDAFDSTVSGMTEQELAATVGTVAAFAGLVGSLVGGSLLNKSSNKNNNGGRSATTRGRSAGGSLLSSAGSMVGGYVAAEIASSSVRALHQDSVNRISYKEECKRAIEAGRPLPPKPKTSFVGNQISDLFKKAMDEMNNNSSSSNHNNNNEYNTNYNHNNGNGDNSSNNRQGGGSGYYDTSSRSSSSNNNGYHHSYSNNNYYNSNYEQNYNNNQGNNQNNNNNNNNNNSSGDQQKNDWMDNITQCGWNLAAKGVKALQRNIDGRINDKQ